MRQPSKKTHLPRRTCLDARKSLANALRSVDGLFRSVVAPLRDSIRLTATGNVINRTLENNLAGGHPARYITTVANSYLMITTSTGGRL